MMLVYHEQFKEWKCGGIFRDWYGRSGAQSFPPPPPNSYTTYWVVFLCKAVETRDVWKGGGMRTPLADLPESSG